MKKLILILIIVINLYSAKTFKELEQEYKKFKPTVTKLKDGNFRAKFYRCSSKIVAGHGRVYDCSKELLAVDAGFNSKGLQNGKYLTYHESGKIQYEDNFKNGVPYGKWLFYDVFGDGKLVGIKEFKGNNTSILKRYDRYSGKLTGIKTYKNGKLNGPNTTYYPNGKVDMSRVYKDNIYWYPAKFYYKSGNLKKYIKYVKDLNITIAYVYKDSDKKEIIKTEYYDFGRNLIKKAYDPGKVITKKEYEKLKSSSK